MLSTKHWKPLPALFQGRKNPQSKTAVLSAFACFCKSFLLFQGILRILGSGRHSKSDNLTLFPRLIRTIRHLAFSRRNMNFTSTLNQTSLNETAASIRRFKEEYPKFWPTKFYHQCWLEPESGSWPNLCSSFRSPTWPKRPWWAAR